MAGLPSLASQYCFGCHLQTLSNPAKKKKYKQKKNHLWHNINYQCRKRENEKGCGKYWAIYEREKEYTWGREKRLY